MAVAQTTAAALIQLLVQELPYATGAAVKRKKKRGNLVLGGHICVVYGLLLEWEPAVGRAEGNNPHWAPCV